MQCNAMPLHWIPQAQHTHASNPDASNMKDRNNERQSRKIVHMSAARFLSHRHVITPSQSMHSSRRTQWTQYRQWYVCCCGFLGVRSSPRCVSILPQAQGIFFPFFAFSLRFVQKKGGICFFVPLDMSFFFLLFISYSCFRFFLWRTFASLKKRGVMWIPGPIS